MRSKTGSLLYSQLSNQQKAVLEKKSAEILLADQFGSFTGPTDNLSFFQAALSTLRTAVEGLQCADSVIIGYIRMANGARIKSKANYGKLVDELKNGFLKFLRERSFTNLDFGQVSGETISDFIFWLKSGDQGLSINTARRRYGTAKRLLERLKKEGHKVSKDLNFQQNPFPDAQRSTRKTSRVDDITFGKMIRACMAEIDMQLNTLRPAWEFLDSGETVEPTDVKIKLHRYRDIRAIWTWKRRFSPNQVIFPTLEEIGVDFPDVAASIKKKGFSSVTQPFYPTPDAIFPFVLLMFIYTLANGGPMFSLLQSGVNEQEVMGTRRIVMDLYKQRSDTYQRSFAIDDSDRFSPQQLLKVVDRWTTHIRSVAGTHARHVFLFVTNDRKIRGFYSGAFDGLGSDVAWMTSFRKFCDKHDLPRMTVRVVRATGLDVTRELHDDDILAVSAVAGTRAGATLEFHYESGPTKLRRAETLLPVMVAYERWAHLGGKPDVRRTPSNSDVLAATPGWNCLDPFASPIPGEREGRSCQAMGRCPACPLGFLDVTSPYALARLVQLADELKAARYYLDYSRWKSAYDTALQYVLKRWLPAFTSQEVIEAAKKFSLSPIGRVE